LLSTASHCGPTSPKLCCLNSFTYTGLGLRQCSYGFTGLLSCVRSAPFAYTNGLTKVGDLGTSGPYCTQLLLNVLCAHSARFGGEYLGNLLISRARHLLGTEILKPCSIATTQALLQLSARELAFGSTSQAWLYSGMAFRMVGDLGLQHSTDDIAQLVSISAEEIEIRKRLFWSCYVWDK
jgi:hypothetical protein